MRKKRGFFRFAKRIPWLFIIFVAFSTAAIWTVHDSLTKLYRAKVAEIERLDSLVAQARAQSDKDPQAWLQAERKRAFAEVEYYIYGLSVLVPVSCIVVAIILLFKTTGAIHRTEHSRKLDPEALAQDEALRNKVRAHFAKKRRN